MIKFHFVMIAGFFVLSGFLIPSVSGYTPTSMTTINGTATSNYASDFRDVRNITPQFFISDSPISIFINSNSFLVENGDAIIFVTDPVGKISEFDIQIVSGNVNFLYLVDVNAPLGLYTFSISPTSANGSFEILSEESNNNVSTEKIPEWIRTIFLWYGQEKISEDELLAAIEFLINQGTINIANQKNTSSMIDQFTIKITTSGGIAGIFEQSIITSKFLDENNSTQSDILRNLISESEDDNIPMSNLMPKCCDHIYTTATVNAIFENQESLFKEFNFPLSYRGDAATQELISIIFDIQSTYPELTKDGFLVPLQ